MSKKKKTIKLLLLSSAFFWAQIALGSNAACVQPAVNLLLLSDEARSSCIAMCVRSRLDFMATSFDSIADPAERAESIANYYDALSPCEQGCSDPGPPDTASSCIVGCEVDAIAEIENCPTGVSATTRGLCLEAAAQSYLRCSVGCG